MCERVSVCRFVLLTSFFRCISVCFYSRFIAVVCRCRGVDCKPHNDENQTRNKNRNTTTAWVEFNRNALFVFRLERCGFYWIFCCICYDAKKIYWQYRFSEFLIIAICRFFHGSDIFCSRWSLVGSRWSALLFFLHIFSYELQHV